MECRYLLIGEPVEEAEAYCLQSCVLLVVPPAGAFCVSPAEASEGLMCFDGRCMPSHGAQWSEALIAGVCSHTGPVEGDISGKCMPSHGAQWRKALVVSVCLNTGPVEGGINGRCMPSHGPSGGRY